LNLPDSTANSRASYPQRPTPLKLTAVPQSRSKPNAKGPARGSFRRRYDELEAHRSTLVNRLAGLGETARRHPGYRRALTLLNETFRKEKLAQRLAVLQAAAWLIDVLEKLSGSST
jgi:hypothetical protein